MVKSILGAAFVVALAACSPEHPPAASNSGEASGGEAAASGRRGTSASPADESPRLARLPDSRAGDSAALEGRLGVAGRCIFVDAGGERILIASMVPGARWDAREGALAVGRERLRRGARIFLSGSFAPTASLAGQWVVGPAEECVTPRAWIASAISAG